MQARQIRVGNVIIYNGELCRVLNVTHITPGNLRAKVQVEMRNLKTGLKAENRFRVEEDVERAVFNEKEMEFLYQEMHKNRELKYYLRLVR